MAKAALVMVVEFKNYRIGGAEMDRLVGAALRARWRSRPAEMQDIILFCRGYTADAETRARELEQELNLTISFKVVP